MYKYGVVIPVYNTNINDIFRCLNSIYYQTESVDEVVIVDDGSTDECRMNYEKIREVFPKVKIIFQKNTGALHARLNGIENLNSEYVLFLDSDDSWCSDLVRSLKEIAEKLTPDIILFDHQRINEKGFSDYRTLQNTESGWCDLDTLIPIMLTSSDLNSVCTKMIKKSLINEAMEDLRKLPILSSGEDMLMSYCLISKAKKVYYYKKALYQYIFNSGSITSSFRLNGYNDILLSRQYRKDICCSLTTINSALLGKYYSAFWDSVSRYIRNLLKQETVDKKIRTDILNEIYSSKLFQEMLSTDADYSFNTASKKLEFLLFKNRFYLLLAIVLKAKNCILNIKVPQKGI